MKKGKIVTILLLGIVLCLLLQILKYEDDQHSVQMEQTMLYSPQSKLITNTLKNVGSNIKGDYRVFCEFREKEQTVRGYYSNDYEIWVPPIKKGKFFTAADTNEAIVGEKIYKSHTNEYNYNGTAYKIIGVFTSNTSYLENLILINDTALFLSEEQQMVIDSTNKISNSYDKNAIDYGSTAAKNSSIAQNDYAYIIKWVGISLVSLSIFFLAIFFCVIIKEEDYVNYLLGISRQKIQYKHMLFLLISYLSVFLLFYSSISFSIKLKENFLIWGYGYLMETIIAYLLIMKWRKFYVPNQ